MADASALRRYSRRTFLGWWLASLLTATVVAGGLPILVYPWPAAPAGPKKKPLAVALATPLDPLGENSPTRIPTPTTPDAALRLAPGRWGKAPRGPAVR